MCGLGWNGSATLSLFFGCRSSFQDFSIKKETTISNKKQERERPNQQRKNEAPSSSLGPKDPVCRQAIEAGGRGKKRRVSLRRASRLRPLRAVIVGSSKKQEGHSFIAISENVSFLSYQYGKLLRVLHTNNLQYWSSEL